MSVSIGSSQAASSSWQRWTMLVWLTSLLLIPALWSWALEQSAANDSPGVQWLSHERLMLQDANGRPLADRPGTPVRLPDSWKPSGLPPVGVGQYTSRFTLSDDMALHGAHTLWSLRFDHLSNVHRIWLNGVLIDSALPRPGWLGLPGPDLIDIPVGLLQAGANELRVEVHAAVLGGLSVPVLAPKTDMQQAFSWHHALTQDILVVLNVVCLTFSLFVVLLWSQRHDESPAGLFGVLFLIAALRNGRYFITADLNLPIWLDSWLYLVAHVVTACVQGLFAMAVFQRPWPAFRAALWAVLVSFPLIGLVAVPFDPSLTQTRSVLQGALILLLLPSLWLMFRNQFRLPTPAWQGLLLSWMLVLGASIHDYVGGRLIGEVTLRYWLPWAIPLALPSFAMMVIGRIVTAFNDIEQANQQLEGKVAERTRELASANAAKSHFLASASHDLRQPVAAIGLITDLLQARLTDPALRSLTDRLMRAVHSMESLLKGLLDLSRLDSGTVDVQRRAVRLQTLLEAIATHEAESARHKGLTLTVRPTPAVVWTDPVLLEQILRNLVGNAIRHTQRGGVLVGVRARGTQWVIQVWDSGPGIAPTDLPRIFEAFVQLGNPGRDRSQGLGLGLAIVQRAASLLGHTLSVSSRVRRGSCFSVSVPTTTARAPEAPQVQAPSVHIALNGLHVLVVEDDQALQDSLVSLLREWGMVVRAGSSVDWARQACQHEPDCVISDHRLPDGTGRDVAQLACRQQHRPVLIITGDTSPEQLAELARSGLPVLHKPFRAEQLRATLQQLLAQPQAMRGATEVGTPQ